MRDAIEDEQLVGNEENHRGRLQGVVRRSRHGRLYVVDELVADEPHGAAGETRQPGDRHGAIFLQHLLDQFEPVAHALPAIGMRFARNRGLVHHPAILQHLNARADLADDRARIAPNERITAEMLASLDRFEKKRFALASDLAVGRQGGLEVGEQAARDGDEISLRSQLLKFFERRRIHRRGVHSGSVGGDQTQNSPRYREARAADSFSPLGEKAAMRGKPNAWCTQFASVGRSPPPPEPEIRIPKPEARKKPEFRNPKG